LPQQIKNFGRQHDVTVLAALGLHDADDLELAVDVANLEAASLTAEREHHLDFEIIVHGQKSGNKNPAF